MSEIKRHEEDVHDAVLDNKLKLSCCDDHKQSVVCEHSKTECITKCEQCDSGAASKNDHKKHVKPMDQGSILDVEVDDLKKSFKTDISDKENKEQEKHENVKKDDSENDKDDVNFKCDMCSDDFEEQELLDVHKHDRHEYELEKWKDAVEEARSAKK